MLSDISMSEPVMNMGHTQKEQQNIVCGLWQLSLIHVHESEKQKETNIVLKVTEYLVPGQALYITICFGFTLGLFLIRRTLPVLGQCSKD